jgi:hypothetical protein
MNLFAKKLPTHDINLRWLFIIVLAIVIVPLFILSFYNQPCWDDYWETTVVRQNGFWGAQKFWYLNWTGRYFALFIISLNPMVFSANWAYKLNAIILLILFIYATFHLCSKLFKDFDNTTKIGISTLFIVAFIFFIPDIGQGIFWQSGAYTCFIPEILTLFFFSSIISYYYSPYKTRYFILSCLLVIAIVGSYEIIMIYADILVFLFTFFSIVRRKKLVFPLSLLFVCIVFSLFSITAPGNSIRAHSNNYPDAHNFMFSLKESFIFCFKPIYLYGKGLLVQWLLFMLLIITASFSMLYKSKLWNEITDTIFIIPLWISFLFCIATPYIGLFICFWAEGKFPPIRTLNAMYFYFEIGMIYFLLCLIASIKKRQHHFKIPIYISLPLILILLFGLNYRTSIIKNNNITMAYNDLILGKASAYNKEIKARHDFLINFKGDSCAIAPVKNIPYSFYFVEISNDQKMEITKTFCDYYNKRYIGIKR